MTPNSIHSNRQQGNVTVVALMLLAVLTFIGLLVSRTSSIDIQIAGNQVPYKQNFYVAEGGVQREAAELGQGNYPVVDVSVFPADLADHDDTGLPGDAHEVAGTAYEFDLDYMGFYLPPKGYSVIYFSRYDYHIDAWGEDVRVGSRYFKIGPKAS